MKKLSLLPILLLLCTFSFAQNKEVADNLVSEGVALHDKGEYKKALAKYEEALGFDKENLLALAEKAYTLTAIGRHEEAVASAQKAIAAHPGDEGLKTVYITCGNAYDAMKKADKALEMYDAGLRQFPDFYLLHFNKGVTQAIAGKYEPAVFSFQQAIANNPKHVGSHNGLARMLYAQTENIPAILAFSRFLVIEPEGNRAKENLGFLQNLLGGDVKKTGQNQFAITMPSADSSAEGKPKVNNFDGIALTLSMAAILDGDKKFKKETPVERMTRKLGLICSMMKETKSANTGFYWTYYAPYFIEMKDKDLVETFAYIAHASTEKPEVLKWLKKHQSEVDAFYKWSEAYTWQKE